MAGAAPAASGSLPESAPPPLGLAEGTKVPSWKLTSASGTTVDLATYAKSKKQRNLLLVFYRTGNCGVCVSYLHELAGQLDRIGEAGTAVLAVSLDDAIVQARTSEQLGGKVPLFLDPDGKLVRHFGVFNPDDKLARPAVFLIAPDRRIKYHHVGRTLVDRPSMEKLLEQLAKHGRSAKRANASQVKSR